MVIGVFTPRIFLARSVGHCRYAVAQHRTPVQWRVHVSVADVRPRSAHVAQSQFEFRKAQPPVRVAYFAKAVELQPPVRGNRQETIIF